MANLKKTLQSSGLLIALSASNKLVGLVSTLILARLLTPDDFGIVAIATLVLGLVEVLSKTGSEQYIVTSTDESELTLNTALTYNAFLKTFIGIILFAFSPLLASFFDDNRLIPILYIFSFMIAFTGYENPQLYLLKKKQEYRNIVRMMIVAKVISVIFAVTTALITKSYWALVIGQFFAYTLPVIGGYIIKPHMPRINFSNIKSQFSFSGWLVPSSMLGYFRSQIDTILISKFFDSSVLGGYHVMKYLAFIPTLHLIAPMTQPLLAQLSMIKNNNDYFNSMFNVSFLVTLAVAAPISSVFFVQSENIVAIVLGEQWIEYSVFMKVFGLMIFVSAIYNQANSLFLVFARTKLSFYFELLSAVVIGVAFIYLSSSEALDFVILKFYTELTLTIAVLFFASNKFLLKTSFFKNTMLIIPVFLSCGLSILLANILTLNSIAIFNLTIWLLVFSFSYSLLITLILIIFRKSSIEYMYIFKKSTEMISKKINDKQGHPHENR